MRDYEYEWSREFPNEAGYYFASSTEDAPDWLKGVLAVVQVMVRKDPAGNRYVDIAGPPLHIVLEGFAMFAKIPAPNVLAGWVHA